MSNKIVYSAGAVPGEPDYDGEILTTEEIQYAAHTFMSKYRVIDPEHVCALTNECINVGTPVESVILPHGMTVKSIHDHETMHLPKGTWVLGIDVTDDNEWNRILSGDATGLSLTAGRTTLKSRVLIRDLGKNWEVKTVSIVKDPAVPKAKFFQILGDGNMTEEVAKSRFDSFVERIEEALKSFKADTTEEPVEVLDDDVESVKSEQVEEEPVEETQQQEEEVDDEEVVEDEQEEDVVTEESEEPVEEAVKFVTAEELETTKAEILEAVKSLMQPGTEDEAVKASGKEDEEDEEEEDGGEVKKDDEDLDEIRKKDLEIADLKKRIEELEGKLSSANKSRSKGIPLHLDNNNETAVKNLYLDDNRDLYGRVIK